MLAPAMGFVDISSPLAGSGASIDGYLNLQQSDLMTDKVDYADTTAIFDYNYFFGADINAISWPRIISNYLDRSCKSAIFCSSNELFSSPAI
jgi:hypothetical protein